MASNFSARPNQEIEKPKKAARRDPRFKPTTGGFIEMKLEKKDPNKSYVLVDESVADMRDHYYALGYRPVIAQEGGVHFAAGITAEPGRNVEARGCTLMSIDKKVREQIEQEGLEYARGRMEEIRRASHVKDIGKDYRGSVGTGAGIAPLDGETEYVDIPTRERQ
jgi:hypothetical protein